MRDQDYEYIHIAEDFLTIAKIAFYMGVIFCVMRSSESVITSLNNMYNLMTNLQHRLQDNIQANRVNAEQQLPDNVLHQQAPVYEAEIVGNAYENGEMHV